MTDKQVLSDKAMQFIYDEIRSVHAQTATIFEAMADRIPDIPLANLYEHIIITGILVNLIANQVDSYTGDKSEFIDEYFGQMKRTLTLLFASRHGEDE